MSFPKGILTVCYTYTDTLLLHASTIYRGGLGAQKTCGCGRNGEENLTQQIPLAYRALRHTGRKIYTAELLASKYQSV